jgi:3-methyladenine DNA glycosylase/8-oxoguanine DNA glycosylase
LSATGQVELRLEVTPRWSFRLPGGGGDGVARRRGAVLERLLHVDGEPVVVRVAQTARDRVLFGAWGPSSAAGNEAIARMRFALGVDDDLREFHGRFRRDPLIGHVVRAKPWLRPPRRPEPFEALAWAVCEQLIDYPRAAAIQRRIVWRLGPRCAHTGLRDVPAPARIAGTSPALLESFDLSHGRSLALVRAAREIARGRVDLRAGDHELGWRRLRQITGIGSWTIAILALYGQGRFDLAPCGDLGLIKLVGRLRSGGDPWARATEQEVDEVFAPYGEYAGLAAVYGLRGGPAPERRAA